MKKLAIFITSLLLSLTCMQSHASLISMSTDQTSYEVGDTVLLDISLENLNSDTQTLGFELNFDENALSFDSFTFSTDVLDYAFLAFNTLVDSNTVNFYVNWAFSSIPSTDFSFGQLSFTATQASTPTIEVSDAYLQDQTGQEFEVSSQTISVPAPEAGLLMILACLFLSIRKKLLSPKK